MIFDTFPFGKYKGIQLIEIPTTYITYALEEFELPKDLDEQLKVILCLRLGLTSDVKNLNVKKVYREMVKNIILIKVVTKFLLVQYLIFTMLF